MPPSLSILEYAVVWCGLRAAPLSHLQEEAHCIGLEEGITLALKCFTYKAATAPEDLGSYHVISAQKTKVICTIGSCGHNS